ncbi:nicotinamide N-methyltransferase-like [Pelobates cultripes]|uniref:Nicotinamide N-methyltransferase-like n=1 Tax=Pelobates cultripes TaxID=61616 RepID=A0AAD1WSF7_PELCU|nr:nicotinamide N-methyltransferase-like [Pelobates cultripes]
METFDSRLEEFLATTEIMEVVSRESASYATYFDSRKYLEAFYGAHLQTQEVAKEIKFVLSFLSKAFASGCIQGDNLIEIAAGPTIWHILSACENFKNIYLTDYSQNNLNEIELWLNEDKNAFDWSSYIKQACELEGGRSTPEEKAEKIREKASFLKCDVTQANPLHPLSLPQADCVIIASCLICVASTLEEFTAYLKNTVSLLKPGGYLVMTEYLRASKYIVGDKIFSVLSVEENVIKKAMADCGCVVEESQIFTICKSYGEVFDSEDVFCVKAKKM